jgi:hypothetical protein
MKTEKNRKDALVKRTQDRTKAGNRETGSISFEHPTWSIQRPASTVCGSWGAAGRRMATPGARSCPQSGKPGDSRTFLARQERIVIPLAKDVRLVSMETVRAVRGLEAPNIVVLAEDHLEPGHIPAFDLGVGDPEPRRELRFWAGALEGANVWRMKVPRKHEAMLDFIVADCLLTSVEELKNRNMDVSAARLMRAWCVSPQTILRLIQCGKLKGTRTRTIWKVNRFSAVEFLRSRAL